MEPAAVELLYTRGNAKGNAWLSKSIFKESLELLKKERDKFEKKIGERVVLVVSYDSAPVHKDLGESWKLNRFESDGIYLHQLPTGVTSLVQVC